MKASPGARSWIAAGVRHELLTRALPALRHDMVAPVSVIRMGLLMLKRQMAADPIDPAACVQRVDLIEHQIGELVTGVRSLRDWELATTDEGVTRSALVAQCAALMRAAYEMQGVTLEIDPALEGLDGETRWPQAAALRYMLLAAMAHLHDGIDDLGAIRFVPEGEKVLALTALPRAVSGRERDSADAHRAPRALAIDAIALQSLADDLGYTVVRDGAVLRLDFGTPA